MKRKLLPFVCLTLLSVLPLYGCNGAAPETEADKKATAPAETPKDGSIKGSNNKSATNPGNLPAPP